MKEAKLVRASRTTFRLGEEFRSGTATTLTFREGSRVSE